MYQPLCTVYTSPLLRGSFNCSSVEESSTTLTPELEETAPLNSTLSLPALHSCTSPFKRDLRFQSINKEFEAIIEIGISVNWYSYRIHLCSHLRARISLRRSGCE